MTQLNWTQYSESGVQLTALQLMPNNPVEPYRVRRFETRFFIIKHSFRLNKHCFETL